jgi:uncharacterized protein
MAVESRFVVIRQGVEVETFMDKKAADEYDKMLDMADNLSEMFEQAPVELSESIREELSVYLAQNREDVLIALQAKKAKVASKKPATTSQTKTESETAKVIEADSVTSTEKAKKPKATSKAKTAVA